MTALLKDLYPLKAQFLPDEPILLMVAFDQPSPQNLLLACTVQDLTTEVLTIHASIPAGEQSYVFTLPPSGVDLRGYGVRVEAWIDGQPAGLLRTAFDTVADYRKAPRYGFLSDFYGEKGADDGDITSMLKLHINLIQFYDWMYRHEDLIPDTEIYIDIMGKPSDLGVIRRKLSRCHQAGMKATAYGAVYAASQPFYEAHPDWSLSYPNGAPITFIDRLYYMDISPGSLWRKHILAQFQKAITDMDFDGIHMDTYGYPKSAYCWRGGKMQKIHLADAFPSLIEENSSNLKAMNPAACIIFNNVGNWPVDRTAPAPVEAVYVEVWDPYSRYLHLRQIILNAQKAGGGKPVILAAYLKPFRTIGAEDPGAEMACLYLTSAIFAHGANHLLFGEERGALTQGYYADYATLSADFYACARKYYDFAVRYLAVLYHPQLVDVSDTHAFGDNMEYRFSGAQFSADGSPGTVWTVIRESDEMKVISFINLTGCQDDRWNEPKEPPAFKGAYEFDIQVNQAPTLVFRANPEHSNGEPRSVDYRLEHTNQGLRLKGRIDDTGLYEMLVILSD